jgi:hypothetical protein
MYVSICYYRERCIFGSHSINQTDQESERKGIGEGGLERGIGKGKYLREGFEEIILCLV